MGFTRILTKEVLTAMNFDRSNFRALLPNKSPGTLPAFNVMADNMVRLNLKFFQALFGEVPLRFLKISYWSKEKQILLELCEEEDQYTVRVPKSGAFGMKSLGKALRESGVSLPAHFEVESVEDGIWIGKYIQEYRFPIQKVTSERAKKPRKNGLTSMLPKEE